MVKAHVYVEIGRVVVINYGELAGKVAVIIDVVDQARALIDGPATLTGVSRQTIPFRNLSLTAIKLDVPRAVRPGTLAKAFTKADVLGQFKKTAWAKKQARAEVRKNLSDFDRFKLMLLRQKKANLINKEFGKLRRAANPAKKAAAKK
mgnify:CR=1 FL=1